VLRSCLWATPGSHKLGTLTRFKRRTNNAIFFDPPNPDNGPNTKSLYSEAGGVPLEVPRGTLVVLHGDLVHWSFANTSAESRHAYTLHVVEGNRVTHEWASDNWIQAPGAFIALNGRG
jgi:phytanoyl-CoA hydroxylase